MSLPKTVEHQYSPIMADIYGSQIGVLPPSKHRMLLYQRIGTEAQASEDEALRMRDPKRSCRCECRTSNGVRRILRNRGSQSHSWVGQRRPFLC